MQATNQKSPKKKVAILMATHKHLDFLDEQLESIVNQIDVDIELWVSRDEASHSNLKRIQNSLLKFPKLTSHILDGPQKGFQYNFLSLAKNKAIKADYYAFSDQDDIWFPGKLKKATDVLSQLPTNKPALYCGRTELINEQGNTFGFSPLFKKAPSFQNALVQSIAGGNTMVFNNKAKLLLNLSQNETIISHDWWLYQLISGADGIINYDPTPMVLYRQHNNNITGHNQDWPSRIKRFKALLNGRFTTWNKQNIKTLNTNKQLLSKNNQRTLEYFQKAHNRSHPTRFKYLYKSKVYRQTTASNLMLYFATLLNKI